MSVVLGAQGIDNNLFTHVGSRDGVATAWIVLSIVDILWIIVLSSDHNSPVLHVFAEEARIRLSSDTSLLPNGYEKARVRSSAPESKEILRTNILSHPSSSDDTARPSDGSTLNKSESDPSSPIARHPTSSAIPDDYQSTINAPTTRSSNAPSSNFSYAQKALALYDYAASPEQYDSEEGELSFFKGDILEVSRTFEKKWWPARNPRTGQIGVVPSNYLKMIPK
ncbi:SH3 domain-containing protein [Rhodocollybia butyracea]|uniref:SH3 domain-containing protein n=1 Tax=Rhodocollybia butyracea TaxID=206335 RepID=A0A9P5PVI2_9AGAR|nr:SH3 domain-containing protein [Rhodocollybia butyracea]